MVGDGVMEEPTGGNVDLFGLCTLPQKTGTPDSAPHTVR